VAGESTTTAQHQEVAFSWNKLKTSPPSGGVSVAMTRRPPPSCAAAVALLSPWQRGLCGEGPRVSDAVHEAPGEESGAAVPLQGALEPAVVPLPVDEDHVPFLQLQLRLALRGVGDHHAVAVDQGDAVRPPPWL